MKAIPVPKLDVSSPKLEPGDLVQIRPDYERKCFAGCIVTVTEPKAWGCQGYVQGVGETFEQPGGCYYVRLKFEDFVLVGRAEWMAAPARGPEPESASPSAG